MSLKTLLLAVTAATAFSTASFADHKSVEIEDAYARVSSPSAKTGAAFLHITNHTDVDDRLIGVKSDVAARVELHTHEAGENGVMRMIHVEEGFDLPAGSEHVLKRGGDHVMLMGLNRSLAHGDVVPVTLVFEKAGEMTVDIKVDLERKAQHGAGHTHGHGHSDGNAEHDHSKHH